MGNDEMIRPPCPYPGPRPFEVQERNFFFGRDRESREIVSLVIAHSAVLVYAQSGAGKTSLLNARVIPVLKERGVDVIGTARVSGELPPGVTGESVRNIFTFHTILGLDHPTPELGASVMTGVGSTSGTAIDPRTRTSTTLTEFVLSRPQREPKREGEIVPPSVVIFDQFEEMFTTSSDRWTDRAAFFDDIGDALEADPNLRVILVMREEFVAALDPFATAFPRRLRTRYRLERLRKPAAVLAVTQPLNGTGYSLARDVADELVENLMRIVVEKPGAPSMADQAAEEAGPTKQQAVHAEFVEPVQLQVVCVQIWDSLPDPPATIDSERIKVYGDVDRALASYFERSIKLAVETDVAVKAGVSEGDLRNWFERTLITTESTRGTVFRGANKTGGLPNSLVELLDTRFRLVRPELRGTATWYELTHDRFIAPIRESNRRYFLEQSDVGRLLRRRTEEWIQKQKKSRYLLRPGELEIALAWKTRQGPLAELGEVEEFLRESRNRLQIRRRVVWTALPIGAIAVALLVGILWTLSGKRRAEMGMYNERGSIASIFAKQPGHEYEALLLGTRAVGPSLERNDTPPDSAVKGLRDALVAIGSAVFLRDSASDRTAVVRFSADGTRVLSAGGSTLSVWDSAGRLLLSKAADPLAGDSEGWADAIFSPDGQRVIAVEGRANFPDLERRFVDRLTRREFAEPSRNQEVASTIARNPRESRFFVFNLQTGARDDVMETQVRQLLEVGFHPDGRLLWTRDSTDVLRLYPQDSPLPSRPVVLPGARRVVVSPQRSRLVLEQLHHFELWDTRSGRRVMSYPGADRRIVFSPDDSVFVTGSIYMVRRAPIEVRNTVAGTLRQLLSRESTLGWVLFSRDARRFAIFSDMENAVTIWDRDDDFPVRGFPIPFGYQVAHFGKYEIVLRKSDPLDQTASLAVWDPFSDQPPIDHPEISFREPGTRIFVSGDGAQVVIVEPEIPRVRLFRFERRPVSLESGSADDLYRIACDRLKTQPAEWRILQQQGLCSNQR